MTTNLLRMGEGHHEGHRHFKNAIHLEGNFQTSVHRRILVSQCPTCKTGGELRDPELGHKPSDSVLHPQV